MRITYYWVRTMLIFLFIYLFVYVTVKCERQSPIDRNNFNTYPFNKLILALQFPKI